MINKLINIILLMFSLLCCFVAIEIGLRVFAPQIIECAINYEWRADDKVLPYVPRTNYKGNMVLKDQFNVGFTTNSAGFRGKKDIPIEKDMNTERIAFIGDSFTFGWGVKDEEVYASLLGEELNKDEKSGVVEILNAAVYGFDIIQYEQVFKRILKYEPDIIFLGFCLENDFNITPLKDKGQIDTSDSIRVERKDIKFYIRDFVNSLHLVTMIRDRLYITFPKIRNIMLSLGINNKRDIFLKQYTGLLQKSLQKTEETLVKMNTAAKKQGIDFVVVLIPLKEQVYCRKEINDFPEYDIDAPNRQMDKILKRNGIKHIDLLPGLLDESKKSKEKLYFDIDPHWTREGHNKSYKIIYDDYFKQ